MIIDTTTQKLVWAREVAYPQPHTQYFLTTLNLLKSLPHNTTDAFLSPTKEHFTFSLRVKQAFFNALLLLLNNFMAYEEYSRSGLGMEVEFAYKAYVKSI